ncbi:ATP-binding protein [Edaphobacter dinghuensis]|uniref:histidine kinase n=1 Tax=Edaphobacter dinghuensis TaxID=1560005 RepID=A0A917HMC3_9BACT|nr:ATP-binding protein [Edaphobacter dinghuensis]GGG83798.1 two-component sensor histidine kinase [Edaphobacter dinghuensis]
MRGLFAKIFFFFWVAQSLTFIISTLLIVQHRFTRPDQVFDALSVTLKSEGAAAAQAYEQGGCSAFHQYALSLSQPVYLADVTGNFLCDAENAKEYSDALSNAERNSPSFSVQVANRSLWPISIASPSGKHYLFILSTPYHAEKRHLTHDLWHFAFPQLPVAIVVFGLTTFILVLVLTRPIARLRAAARELARGQLDTRIPSQHRETHIFGGDEIQGLEHDFNHMAEQLESLVAAQKLLLRDVSHELRSPLARLSVALELAREDAPMTMSENLERIERETGRLNALIGQLLRLSSLESSNTAVETEAFSLKHLLEELLPDIEFEALQRTCSIKLEATCDCTVHGNFELIYRAIENIARNAIRYTKEVSSVDVDLGCEIREGRRICVLKISDRGPGVPESELQNIFRPFYRVDNARQRDTGGFGIGLAIAERAIRLHQGQVYAINREGGGITMVVTLPCHDAISQEKGL